MDLLKTVVESGAQTRVSLETWKQTIEQHKTYSNQLMETLQEMQLRHRRNIEILEINNMTKNSFNRNLKEIKCLFGFIYKHCQETGENLALLTAFQESLENLSNKNQEKMKMLETAITKRRKIYNSRKEMLNKQRLLERKALQQEIDETDAEYQKCELIWDNTLEQYTEKQNQLQSIKMEIDIMQDNLDKEVQQNETLLQEANHKLLKEANSMAEMNDRILETEEQILLLTNKKAELIEKKEKITQKQNEVKLTLQDLENECVNLEKMITKTEQENATYVENMTIEIETKTKLIEENEAQLGASKLKTDEIKKEIENFNLKIAALDEELATLKQNAKSAVLETSEVEKMAKKNEHLVKECTYFETLIAQRNSDITKKQQELDTLKATQNLELLELQEELMAIEADRFKNVCIGKEIEELELKNNNLQQSNEQHQTTIKDYSERGIKIQFEMEENQKQLANVTKQCDDLEKEIQLLEQQKSEKRRHSAPDQPVKRSVQTTRKRVSLIDLETDSEGDRMTYSEFMARKKMKEKKRNM